MRPRHWSRRVCLLGGLAAVMGLLLPLPAWALVFEVPPWLVPNNPNPPGNVPIQPSDPTELISLDPGRPPELQHDRPDTPPPPPDLPPDEPPPDEPPPPSELTPEPASLVGALFGAGALGLAAWRRRQAARRID